MRRTPTALIFLIGLLGVAACTSVERNSGMPPQTALVANSAVTAELRALPSGQWTVDFEFAEAQKAMIFERSAGGYRVDTWTPNGNAPEIQRINGLDAIVFASPATSASYTFTPYTNMIDREYTPFIPFSDGAFALFTGQFNLLPVAGAAEIERLAGDLSAWTGDQPRVGIRVFSDQPILAEGARRSTPYETSGLGDGTYVYVGTSQLEEGDSYSGVIDTGLPDHIRANFDADLRTVFTEYERRWGFELPKKATVYFASGGFEAEGFSNKGSVVGGDLVALQVSGKQMLEQSPRIRANLMWFFAHEAAHMFQCANSTYCGNDRDAWWHEGTANLMANQIVGQASGTPAEFSLSQFKDEVDDCRTAIELAPLKNMQGRGPYACGNLIALAIDASLRDATIYDLWKDWQTASALAGPDQTVADSVFSVLTARGVPSDLIAAIRSLVETRQPDGLASIRRLLDAGSVDYSLSPGGELTAIGLPE